MQIHKETVVARNAVPHRFSAVIRLNLSMEYYCFLADLHLQSTIVLMCFDRRFLSFESFQDLDV